MHETSLNSHLSSCSSPRHRVWQRDPTPATFDPPITREEGRTWERHSQWLKKWKKPTWCVQRSSSSQTKHLRFMSLWRTKVLEGTLRVLLCHFLGSRFEESIIWARRLPSARPILRCTLCDERSYGEKWAALNERRLRDSSCAPALNLIGSSWLCGWHIFAAYEKDIGVTDLICSLLSSDHRFCIAVWATSTFGEENIAD